MSSTTAALEAPPVGPPDPPPYKTVRYDEDYRYLRDPARRTEALDALKYLPLDSSGGAWLTVGGEVRERYEYYDHYNWGLGPQDPDGYLLQRYLLLADVHYQDTVRVFGQFASVLEEGRIGGPRPIDEDIADLHQAFLEVSLRPTDTDELRLRLGRQEMYFGSQRLVSVRESPNTRLSFEGIRLEYRRTGLDLSAFLTQPVENRPGAFDNARDEDATFWGVYGVTPVPWGSGTQWDLYYLGLDHSGAAYNAGTGREVRHSVGTRLAGKAAAWDFNLEAVYQFGTFRDGAISAWTAASETGFRFANAPFQPRLFLKADVASGDETPGDRSLNTFDALFPRGAYFSETGLVGPANIIDLHPGIELRLPHHLAISADWDFFWRESAGDGVYNNALKLVRGDRTGSDRFLGSQVQAQVQWSPSRHLVASLVYAHFLAGDFLAQGPAGHDVNFVSTWVTLRF